jgi:hypothetical protein
MMKSRKEPSSDAHVKRKRDLGSGKGDGGKSTFVTLSFGTVIDIYL